MSCAHTTEFDDRSWTAPEPDSTDGCADCAAIGSTVWAHLRMCLACGHVACCDSSPHRHATRHHADTGPPGDALVRAGRGLALVLRGQAHRLRGP